MKFKVTESTINIAYYFLLLPLNAGLIAWIVIMNYAYAYPTSNSVTFSLRSGGTRKFTIYYGLCIAVSALIGAVNTLIVFIAFKQVPRRLNKLKALTSLPCCRGTPLYKALGAFGLLFVASYGLIASLAFREPLARSAFENACKDYALMADISILENFPDYDGNPGSSPYDASSSIRFYKYGVYQYTMDLVRMYNQTLGFQQYQDGAKPSDPRDGVFNLTLRSNAKEGREEDFIEDVEYYNVSALVEADEKQRKRLPKPPGPVANVQFSLYNSSYKITFSNSSAPGFDADTKTGVFSSSRRALAFNDLDLHKSSVKHWRFPGGICLPPRVSLKHEYHVKDDVFGQIADGCQRYRLCALRKPLPEADREWEKWVESVWQAVVGPVVWGFEEFSQCCVRGE